MLKVVKDFIGLIKEAKERGDSVVTLITLFVSAIGELITLFGYNISSWAAPFGVHRWMQPVALAVLFLLCLVQLLYEKWQSLQDRVAPKLRLSGSRKNPLCHKAGTPTTNAFHRIIVENLGESEITRCQGDLIRIEDLYGRPIMNNEVRHLPFEPSHSPDARNMTIRHGVPYPLDVLVVGPTQGIRLLVNDGRTEGIITLEDNNGVPLFQTPQKCVFVICVTGTGPNSKSESRTERFLYDWTGNRDSAELSLIENTTARKEVEQT